MIPGCATAEGTLRFSKESGAAEANFGLACGLSLSNVGIGTYLGDPDARTDEMVRGAIKRSVRSGINVIDTAINYRSQLAERCVGAAVSEMITEGAALREQLFISTKNGYVTDDAAVPGDFWSYVNEQYVQNNVIGKGDITSGYHCMKVAYLEDQLRRSLENLGVECIDLLYLHNAAEGQLKYVSRDDFTNMLRDAFTLYERKRAEGRIKFYGMATWDCFRSAPEEQVYLSMEDVVGMAKDAGGEDHGFRFIQMPFNLYYDQALLSKTQTLGTRHVSALEAARELGLGVFTSVPFMQGKLLQPGVMPEFAKLSAPLRALQFVRSTPGVLAPLVGHKSAAHLDENLSIMEIPPIPESDFDPLVRKLTSRGA